MKEVGGLEKRFKTSGVGHELRGWGSESTLEQVVLDLGLQKRFIASRFGQFAVLIEGVNLHHPSLRGHGWSGFLHTAQS